MPLAGCAAMRSVSAARGALGQQRRPQGSPAAGPPTLRSATRQGRVAGHKEDARAGARTLLRPPALTARGLRTAHRQQLRPRRAGILLRLPRPDPPADAPPAPPPPMADPTTPQRAAAGGAYISGDDGMRSSGGRGGQGVEEAGEEVLAWRGLRCGIFLFRFGIIGISGPGGFRTLAAMGASGGGRAEGVRLSQGMI